MRSVASDAGTVVVGIQQGVTEELGTGARSVLK
jgi:hypothetical protein